MNKEECMLILEQMILELAQYREITNELCNKYIPIYVKETYEQKQIYIEGDHSSSKNYCWDIYDTIPIEIIETILNNFKEQDNIKQENTNLKQALIDIRESCEDNGIDVNTREYGNLVVTNIDDILQIIDKVLGGSDE